MSKLLDSIKSIPQLNSGFSADNEKPDHSSQELSQFMSSHPESKKKSEFGDIGDFDVDLTDIVSDINDEFSDDTFVDMDNFFDSFGDMDGDVELQNNLISLGRKYSHEGGSKEVSDIQAKFTPQKTALTKLISDLDSDIALVGKDISNMRMSRSRNFKAMSDLISAQSSLYSTKLSAIKEQSSIEKTIADLKLKIDGKNSATEDQSVTASMAIQQLFSGGDSGTSVTINSDDISTSGSNSAVVERQIDDDENIKNIFGNDTGEETEGDIYLKYEDRNVSIHCVMNKETGEKHLIAKDSNGTVIPDYPIPPNSENLIFTLHDDLGTATDNLGRDYILDYE